MGPTHAPGAVPLLVRRWQVAATLAEAARATEIAGDLLPQRLAPEDRDLLLVAFSEVLTNVVRHGFDGGPGEPVEIAWIEWPQVLEIEVRDRGRPIPAERLATAGDEVFGFDPDDLAALPEGGMGLAIVKTVFDAVDYASAGGVNVLQLRKHLPLESSG